MADIPQTPDEATREQQTPAACETRRHGGRGRHPCAAARLATALPGESAGHEQQWLKRRQASALAALPFWILPCGGIATAFAFPAAWAFAFALPLAPWHFPFTVGGCFGVWASAAGAFSAGAASSAFRKTLLSAISTRNRPILLTSPFWLTNQPASAARRSPLRPEGRLNIIVC